jgi:hypothetical protein
VLNAPNVVFAEATSPQGGPGSWTATATDDLDPSPTVSCTPTSPVYATLYGTPISVTCTARDLAGNTTSKTFLVRAVDRTPPQTTCPANVQVVLPQGAAGTPVQFTTPTATDIVGVYYTLLDHASGDSFPAGDTLVTFRAVDLANNWGSCSFHVIVLDQEPPVLTLPVRLDVDASDPKYGFVQYTPSATDNAGVTQYDCNPDVYKGEWLPIGDTSVTCTVHDAAGNSASGTFDVHVRDAYEMIDVLLRLLPRLPSTKPASVIQQDLVDARDYLLNSRQPDACLSILDARNVAKTMTGNEQDIVVPRLSRLWGTVDC